MPDWPIYSLQHLYPLCQRVLTDNYILVMEEKDNQVITELGVICLITEQGTRLFELYALLLNKEQDLLSYMPYY